MKITHLFKFPPPQQVQLALSKANIFFVWAILQMIALRNKRAHNKLSTKIKVRKQLMIVCGDVGLESCMPT